VEPLIETPKDEDRPHRMRSAQALAKISDLRAAEPLIDSLGDYPYVAEMAMWALLKMRKLIIPILIKALKEKAPPIREKVADILGKVKSPASIRALIDAFTDKSPKVRSAAALSLGFLKASQAVEFLIESLKDTHSDVRRNAAIALG